MVHSIVASKYTYAGYIILVTRPDLSSLDDPAYADLVLTSKISYENLLLGMRFLRPEAIAN